MNNKQRLLKNTIRELLKDKSDLLDYEMASEIMSGFVAKDKKLIEKAPVLQGILHRDNELIASNGTIVVQLDNVDHEELGVFKVDGKRIKKKFPSLAFLMNPEGKIYFKKEMSVVEWIDIHRNAWKYCKNDKNGYPIMFDGTFFCAKDKESKEYFREALKHENKEIIIHYDCKLMLKALDALNKLKISSFVFEYRGEREPLVIRANNIVVCLLPLRM